MDVYILTPLADTLLPPGKGSRVRVQAEMPPLIKLSLTFRYSRNEYSYHCRLPGKECGTANTLIRLSLSALNADDNINVIKKTVALVSRFGGRSDMEQCTALTRLTGTVRLRLAH